MYVSFVEIFQKSVGAFDDMNKFKIVDEDKRWGLANLYATLSFFAGVFIMIAIDLVIKALSKESSKSDDSSNSQASDHCGSHSDHHDISDSLQKVEDGCPP